MTGDLAQKFIDSLRSALFAYLEPYAPNMTVFLDERKMTAPALLDPTLAQRICESVLMVVVLTPGYFDVGNPWCAREYQGMIELEAKRLERLPKTAKARSHGLIVPIVFRSPQSVPDEIRSRRLFIDFSQYTLAATNIGRQKSYINKIQGIAESFSEILQDFEQLNADPCPDCATFVLPDEPQVQAFLKSIRPRRQTLPSEWEVPK